MKTCFKVEGTLKLPNETIVLIGSVEGPLLIRGQRGTLATGSCDVEVEIVGVGIVDPNLVKPNMQMVLCKLLRGEYQFLQGTTLAFD